MRVDVWDSGKAAKVETDLGYPRDLEAKFVLGDTLGKGGFGTVRLATEKTSGEELACKSIAKRLPDTTDPTRNAKHQANIRREIAVLYALKGALNVANVKDVTARPASTPSTSLHPSQPGLLLSLRVRAC